MERNSPELFQDTSIAFSGVSDEALQKMYQLFALMNRPLLVNLGTNFIKIALLLRLPVKSLIRNTIFRQFCGGETIEECREASLELNKYGIKTVLDYSVEGTEEEEDFDRITNEILHTIEKSGIPPKNPFCVFKVSGIASSVLLEKIHQGDHLDEAEQRAWEKVQERVGRICDHAYHQDLPVFIDAEESWMQDPIDALVYDMMERYNRQRAIVYNTYQMYRRDMLKRLQEAYQRAETYNYHLGVKLVRGAYMEKERERAEEMGYADPIQPDKRSTDKDFNEALHFCVENMHCISLCCGSHNEYSNYYLTQLMEERGVHPQDPRFHFVQLYGMSDNISFNLAHRGFNVAKLLPYGPIKKVIPYLIRRAEENTAIRGQSSREFTLIKKEMARRRSTA